MDWQTSSRQLNAGAIRGAGTLRSIEETSSERQSGIAGTSD
jgi:hypothetical protein